LAEFVRATGGATQPATTIYEKKSAPLGNAMNLRTLTAAALVLSLAAPAAIGQNALDQRLDARSQPRQAPVWWCDTWGTYYPYVLSCPVPWRPVNPVRASPQPYRAAPSPVGAAEAPAAPAQTTQARAAPPPSFRTLGDGLDDWCAKAKLASSIAICSDAELRSLMIERGRAFDEAKSRLPLDQRKALLVDQKGWVASYPQACGVARDVAPLPLAPAIKDCMAQAGRARIAYLRGYDLPAVGNLTAEAPTARPAAANEAQFAEGLRDRTAWEDWFNGLSGDEIGGAAFWAAERSKPNPGDCLGTAAFIQGCQEAKARLASADLLRKSEPAYRTGWNSYVRPASPLPAAEPPAPIARPVAATDVQQLLRQYDVLWKRRDVIFTQENAVKDAIKNGTASPDDLHRSVAEEQRINEQLRQLKIEINKRKPIPTDPSDVITQLKDIPQEELTSEQKKALQDAEAYKIDHPAPVAAIVVPESMALEKMAIMMKRGQEFTHCHELRLIGNVCPPLSDNQKLIKDISDAGRALNQRMRNCLFLSTSLPTLSGNEIENCHIPDELVPQAEVYLDALRLVIYRN
jgi:hypothetical protein